MFLVERMEEGRTGFESLRFPTQRSCFTGRRRERPVDSRGVRHGRRGMHSESHVRSGITGSAELVAIINEPWLRCYAGSSLAPDLYGGMGAGNDGSR